jgi:hypothetical protein
VDETAVDSQLEGKGLAGRCSTLVEVEAEAKAADIAFLVEDTGSQAEVGHMADEAAAGDVG